MRVLHVLPHRGGGAETYLDLLERLDGVEHARVALAASPTARLSVARGTVAAARARRSADVVHAHGDVAAALSRPDVWTTHGLHMLRRAPWFAKVLRRTTRRAAVTLCTSASERDDLLAIGAPAERLVVAHNGVDLPPPRERDWDPACPVALFAGELSERKDPLTAARAARAAGVPLLVAGDGPLRDAVAAEGAEVLGHVTDMAAVYARADILVLPSEREGLSFAVLEAMAHGLAMVVSQASAEAVGNAGIVVAPGGDYAAALRAATPAHGVAARERAAKHFTVEAMLDAVRHAYQLTERR